MASCLYAQETGERHVSKELLIIGTMHEVPSIVSRSYRPLLKYAKKYQPEAIYTEDIRSNDTLSLKNKGNAETDISRTSSEVDVRRII